VGRIASGALIERLADRGVDTVFGLPSDGINGIMEGLRRHRGRVRFLLGQHEERPGRGPAPGSRPSCP
jgi:pyruvate dehydrogenase (quinone)